MTAFSNPRLGMKRHLPLLSVMIAGAVLLTSQSALADTSANEGWLGNTSSTGLESIRETWADGATDVYLPLHTYHLRSAYSAEKLRTLNENPWGFGLGKSKEDEKGETLIYAMAFKDSHCEFEPMVGVARLWNLAGSAKFRLQAGVTGFLTSRGDTMHYFPFPGVLPLISVKAGRASLMATYIPGGAGYGNVGFLFGKYTFGK